MGRTVAAGPGRAPPRGAGPRREGPLLCGDSEAKRAGVRGKRSGMRNDQKF